MANFSPANRYRRRQVHTPIVLEGAGNSRCIPSITLIILFLLNFYTYSGNGESGRCVVFYSEPHGWDTGQQAGFRKITESDMRASASVVV